MEEMEQMPFDLGNYGQLGGSGGGGMSSMQWVQLVSALAGGANGQPNNAPVPYAPPTAGGQPGGASAPPPAPAAPGPANVPGSWNAMVGGQQLGSPRAGAPGGGYKPYLQQSGSGSSY